MLIKSEENGHHACNTLIK